jgi:hypothetical protein
MVLNGALELTPSHRISGSFSGTQEELSPSTMLMPADGFTVNESDDNLPDFILNSYYDIDDDIDDDDDYEDDDDDYEDDLEDDEDDDDEDDDDDYEDDYDESEDDDDDDYEDEDDDYEDE